MTQKFVKADGTIRPYPINYWKDMLGGGSSLGTGGSAPARTRLGTSNIYYNAYNVAGNDGFSTEIQFNHDAVQGSSVVISPHLHVMLPAAPSAGDNVKFSFDYTFASFDGNFTSSPTNDLKETLLTGKTQWQHLIIDFTDITVTMGISSIMLCGVTRVAASTNEYGSGIAIIGFDIHYTVNTPGSASEYVK